MLTCLLNEGFKRENRLFFGVSTVAGIIVFLLMLHYVFGFFPTVSYLNG